MKFKLLLVLFFSFFIINCAYAQNEKNMVRVALTNQNFSKWDYTNSFFSSQGTIKIVDMSQNIEFTTENIKPIVEISINNGVFSIFVDGEQKYDNLQGPILLSSNEPLEITKLNRKGIPARYKGMLEIRKAQGDKTFRIINVINTQDYLRGVVPNEMPVSFGIEALMAQSVAARNYVNTSKMSPDYDVLDSTASQVYYGVNSYKDVSDKAVYQTRGIYALYNEKPISALYFSTSPGITDDWNDVFNMGVNSDKHPYLKPVFDYNQHALTTEHDVKTFYSKKNNGLDVNSPKFRWQIEFTRSELEKILNNTLLQQSKTGLVIPKYDENKPLEGLKNIKALKRTVSGKITELLIEADSGSYVVKKESTIRKVFKKNNIALPSANFYIEQLKEQTIDKEENKNDVFSETQEEKETRFFDFFDFSFAQKYPEIFKFIGGGYGHNVGMSQFGAYGLAKKGKKYPQILKYYYTGINISTMPKTVLYNEYNISYKTEFYFDNKTFSKAYLLIDNRKKTTSFPFMVNEYEFSNTNEAAKNKIVKIDITKYLKNGINLIAFLPLSRSNKGKYVIYRVELI